MKKEVKKKTNTKRDVMRDLVKKAIEARDGEVKEAKEEMKGARIPGLNRATVRKIIKRQRNAVKIQKKREFYKAKMLGEKAREEANEKDKD